MAPARYRQALGYEGYGVANLGAMGGGVSSGLRVISSLPYRLPGDAAIVHALEPTGEIVVEIHGATDRLAPGESWVNVREWDPTDECHRKTTVRFTNYGLLDDSQLQ